MNIIQKGLTIAVVTLFIGVAIAPSVNANISKENLVEFTTEICGLNGGKQTVKLTQEESEEVEALFNSIRARLNATKSREEAEEIFKEAVVELDKYGLLGGLSVKQAQRLVTGGYKNLLVDRIFGNIFHKYLDNFDNVNCLISGSTSETRFIRPILRFLERIISIVYGQGIVYNIAVILLIMFMIIDIAFGNTVFSPLKIGTYISFGSYDYFKPAQTLTEGWLHTVGMFGIKDWEGLFRGLIFSFHHFDHIAYVGVVGFTGIKLVKEFGSYYYLGTALGVKIGNP